MIGSVAPAREHHCRRNQSNAQDLMLDSSNGVHIPGALFTGSRAVLVEGEGGDGFHDTGKAARGPR
jgi:hypothetical protein